MKKDKTILIATPLYPPDIGGPATYSRLLEEELPKQGWTVTVISFGQVRRYPKIIRHLVYGWQIFKLIPNYQIIYAQDPVSVGLPVCLACCLRRRKFRLKIVGDYAWEQGSQRFGVTALLDKFSLEFKKYSWPVKLLKLVQTGVAKRAQKIIVPSNYLKKIVSNWGIKSEKIKVIYNAFNQPAELPSKDVLRQELGLVGQVLVSAGRLVPWKGFALLIEIISELKNTYPDLQLLIIGDGPEEIKLERKIESLNLAKQIKLLGRLPQVELLQYLKAVDGFVLNTSYEGLSHQLLEAMWCGTPIITTEVGGNPELIENGRTGWLVAYNNHDEWRETIEELLTNTSLASYLAEQAKQKVQSFTKELMIENLIREL